MKKIGNEPPTKERIDSLTRLGRGLHYSDLNFNDNTRLVVGETGGLAACHFVRSVFIRKMKEGKRLFSRLWLRPLKVLLFVFLSLIGFCSVAQQSVNGHLIGRYLQQQYDINDAVFLTQKAWQLSHSFASEEQMLSQWQDALEQVEKSPKKTPQAFPKINSHATAAQLLTQYSNGMNLQLWRMTDLPPTATFSPTERTPAAKKFQVYLNLPDLWQQLLKNTQAQAKWLAWTKTLDQEIDNTSDEQPLLLKVLKAVQEEATLAAQLKVVANDGKFDQLQTAILRQQYHKKHHLLLAYAYDWIEIYQLLETGTWLLTASEQQQMQQLMESNQRWWNNRQAEVELIDRDVFSTIEQLNQQLPEKFKNPDHFNSDLNRLIFATLLDLKNTERYFNAPARQQLQQNLEICLNISAEQAPNPQQPISQKQFKSCIQDFVRWAEKTAKNVALAGEREIAGDKLKTHLKLKKPSFQNINLLYSLLLVDENCRQQLKVKASPIEWLLAAESLAWFADRWPGLIAELEDRRDFVKLRQQGQELFALPDCVQAGQALDNRFKSLESAWQQLKQAIRDTIDSYRRQHLVEGSQIDFFKTNEQIIKVTEQHKMSIAPCDLSQSCGAFAELPINSTLFDLFPNHLKMAEQFAMGELTICYDSVEWVNRETAPTHLNNDKIANYTGQLSIQVNGKYKQQTVFSKSIIGQKRHLYLFAANTQEVMDMGCPVSIIGKEISTKLDRGTLGLFPNRLTFLTAQRTDINSVLESNWKQGENWLSELADNSQGELSLIDEKTELKSTVNETFLKHSNQLQQKIYSLMVNPGKQQGLSTAVIEYLNQRKLLAAEVKAIFHDLFLQPEIRQALSGSMRLPDQDYFGQKFNQQTNLFDMLNEAEQRIEMHKNIWYNTVNPDNSILSVETQKQLYSEIK